MFFKKNCFLFQFFNFFLDLQTQSITLDYSNTPASEGGYQAVDFAPSSLDQNQYQTIASSSFNTVEPSYQSNDLRQDDVDRTGYQSLFFSYFHWFFGIFSIYFLIF